MKLTEEQLRQIIKESVKRALNEGKYSEIDRNYGKKANLTYHDSDEYFVHDKRRSQHGNELWETIVSGVEHFVWRINNQVRNLKKHINNNEYCTDWKTKQRMIDGALKYTDEMPKIAYKMVQHLNEDYLPFIERTNLVLNDIKEARQLLSNYEIYYDNGRYRGGLWPGGDGFTYRDLYDDTLYREITIPIETLQEKFKTVKQKSDDIQKQRNQQETIDNQEKEPQELIQKRKRLLDFFKRK